MTLSIDELRQATNAAELLDDSELRRIGQKIVEHLDVDEESRSEWQERVDKAMDIAKQTMEVKNHPFTKSSNVKFPLITQAAIDFAARTYPELIQNDRVVKSAVVGKDVENYKADKGARVAKYMSYQLLHKMEQFEDGVDKMLHVLPILGTAFKKTYYDPIKGCPVSELCTPDLVVVNYDTASLEEARRVSHILIMHSNDIVERIRSGLFLDCDVDELIRADEHDVNDEDAPLELIEQHCYLDLDDDGYQEPYIVTVHRNSGKVLRITQRFGEIKTNSDGEVVRIEPIQYFTDYHFIRSPDGGFYSSGLGTILYPLNEAINTLINQLIDAGTLNNMQSGFIGRGLRLKNGEFRLRLGEWKVLEAASGTNIGQNVFPLPTKEPSQTLFQLLGLLIDIGKDLSSANDVMQGKGQTQNVAATTVLAMVEQGMKVYNAISKRLYRSLRKEFNKIYDLNSKHLTNEEYKEVLDDPEANVERDYDRASVDIVPVADPSMASDAQRLARAQAILQAPGVDPYEAGKYYLEALQLDKEVIEKLLPKPQEDAPPPPELLKVMAEIEKLKADTAFKSTEAQVIQLEAQTGIEKLKVARDEAIARAEESSARVMKMKQDALNNAAKVELAESKSEHGAQLAELDALHKREKDEVDLSIRAADVAIKAKGNDKDEQDI